MITFMFEQYFDEFFIYLDFKIKNQSSCILLLDTLDVRFSDM